jgi:hypothetical protein
MPPKTGPIPRELLEPALYSSGMTAHNSRALLRSCEWRGAGQIQRGTYLRAISSPSDSWHVILMLTHLRLMHYLAELFKLW